jgi:hypothetical protein
MRDRDLASESDGRAQHRRSRGRANPRRIRVNLGDVLIDRDEISGDGVNLVRGWRHRGTAGRLHLGFRAPLRDRSGERLDASETRRPD